MLEGRVEETAALGELVHGERLVLGRLVDDGSLVNLMVDGDGSVLADVLVSVTLNHGLNHVVNVVRGVLKDTLTTVNNGLLLASIGNRIAGGVQSSELGLVLVRRDVVLPDVGNRDSLLVVLLRSVLGVENRLSVVLDVVDVTVNLALALNLLDFVAVTGLVGDGGKVLVVVCGRRGGGLAEETVLLGLVVVVTRGLGVLAEVLSATLDAAVDLALYTGTSAGGGSSRGAGRGGRVGNVVGAGRVGLDDVGGAITGGRVRGGGSLVVGVGLGGRGGRLVVGDGLLNLVDDGGHG